MTGWSAASACGSIHRPFAVPFGASERVRDAGARDQHYARADELAGDAGRAVRSISARSRRRPGQIRAHTSARASYSPGGWWSTASGSSPSTPWTGAWDRDTHADNFNALREGYGVNLDNAYATLLEDMALAACWTARWS